MERSPRLALEFTGAVEEALSFVREHTEAGTPVRGVLRGWLVRRFPYRVICREEESRIYVLAIAHHRRKPSYWHRRK
ncbi:MAG TPA: type II toxin-antitoxin system RelE/ParE family toxin [Longimicrobiaceae bacterium]|nr:type II toxin-antitoxin system RelE/ParE family toxin [Longimicrobiaceae bacterium]